VRIKAALLDQHTRPPTITRRTYHPARVEARQLIEGLAKADWATARKKRQALAALPTDAAPVVRRLLDGDVRQLDVPARLTVLQLMAQWRDRASVPLVDKLNALLDNPPWMSACVAITRTSAARDGRVSRWIDLVARLAPGVLSSKTPDQGPVAADIARLIAPQGRPALAAMHRDARYRSSSTPLAGVYRAAIDAMVAYGWPVSVWLKDFGGR
jgi:hypothetical protein